MGPKWQQDGPLEPPQIGIYSVGFTWKQEQRVEEGGVVKCARVDVRGGVEASVAHLPFPCWRLPVSCSRAKGNGGGAQRVFVFSCLT